MTLSAIAMAFSKRLPLKPAGVSSTIWVVPLGGLATRPSSISHASIFDVWIFLFQLGEKLRKV